VLMGVAVKDSRDALIFCVSDVRRRYQLAFTILDKGEGKPNNQYGTSKPKTCHPAYIKFCHSSAFSLDQTPIHITPKITDDHGAESSGEKRSEDLDKQLFFGGHKIRSTSFNDELTTRVQVSLDDDSASAVFIAKHSEFDTRVA